MVLLDEGRVMTVTEHLAELRRVIIICLVAVSFTSILVYFGFREQLLALITRPMEEMNLPIVYVSIQEGFFTQIKLCGLAGFLLALPVVMWQIWSFVAPALHTHERKYIYRLTILSVILFLGGVVFAYLTIFRFAIKFLVLIAGEQLTPMISVAQYISFMVAFLVPFGIVFELPIISYFLTKLSIISPELLARNRRYAVVACFVLAAILTPGPDPISQLLMAGPMVLLYEISIWVSFVVRRRQKDILPQA